jgi:hypothetical protein
LDYLERTGAIEVEGLFRVSGSAAETAELKKAFDKGKKGNIIYFFFPRFLREMLQWIFSRRRGIRM